jgi:hypothetical protein
VWQVSFTEKGAISKTISSASLSTSATSAFVAEIKKGREQVGSHSADFLAAIELIEDGYSCVWQVPFTKKGSGGETITLASSFTSSTSQNSATTASTSSVLSPKKPLDITSPSCVKTQPSSKESA